MPYTTAADSITFLIRNPEYLGLIVFAGIGAYLYNKLKQQY